MLLVLDQNKLLTSLIREATDNIKLKNLLESFFITTPNIPPKVVPNVPKNNPTKVVFKISINPPKLPIINLFGFNIFITILSFLQSSRG